MPRIIYPGISINQKEVKITSAELIKYIRNVLRLKPGEVLELLDGRGTIYSGTIRSVSKAAIEISISDQRKERQQGTALVLIQPLLKGDKMDLVIQKCTELGVTEIYPATTERTIPRTTRKLHHWRRVAEEATRQSGRTIVPEIHEVTDLRELLPRFSGMDCVKIVFYEHATGLLRSISYDRMPEKILYLTGPEGGFTDREIKEAEAAGFKVVSLGGGILRAETASIVSLALIKYHFGLM